MDRIIGVEKNRIKQDTTCKSRYFNLMEPLLAGYLTYHKLMSIPINQVIAKRII